MADCFFSKRRKRAAARGRRIRGAKRSRFSPLMDLPSSSWEHGALCAPTSYRDRCERNTRGRSGGSSAQTVLPLTPGKAGASCLGRVQQHKSIRKNRCAKSDSLHTVTAARPRLPAPAQKETDATLSHRKFFHSMWRKFGCGRGQPVTSLGGGDSQEGAKPPPLVRPPRRRVSFFAKAAIYQLSEPSSGITAFMPVMATSIIESSGSNTVRC